MVSAVVHGNEISGAIVIDRLLRGDFKPHCGTLLLGFMNIDAYQRFDVTDPGGSRFVDEDFNRVWSKAVLDGPGDSLELRRARQVRPVLEDVDYLLDLHSTSGYGGPMILTGMTDRSLAFARSLAAEAPLIRDAGHRAGCRMRDYGAFAEDDADPTALLVECGQHWNSASVEFAADILHRFLYRLGMTELALPAHPQRVLTVTHAVTAATGSFRFVAGYQGMEAIRKAGTVIAHDGEDPVATLYDDCTLIMPTHDCRAGQTAVRFAKDTP